MAKRITIGTKQLALNIDADVRDRLSERIVKEQRTLRAVVERALTFYMDSVPVEEMPKAAGKEKPKK